MSIVMKVYELFAAIPPVSRMGFKMIFRRDGTPPFKKPKLKPDDPETEILRRREVQTEKGKQLLSQRASERLTMINDRGNRVEALFVPAQSDTDKFVILSHGYRSEGLREFGAFLPFYFEQPVHLLIADHQAHGASEGSIITFGAQEHIDLIAWANRLVCRFGPDIKIMLHGISMGSATVMQAAGSEKLPVQVRTVLADCGYTSLENEIKTCLRSFGVKEQVWVYLEKLFQKETGHDPKSVNALEAVRRSHVPVHLIHGDADHFVPTAMSEEIHRDVPETELILIKGAGHAESWICGQEEYKALITRCIAEMDL